MSERLIFHVDVNSAFLSWEAVRCVKRGERDLREIPSAISGDPQKRRGVILAKSIPAKAYGVRTGEPLAAALRKCPNLVTAPPDHAYYHEMSEAFISICQEYAPVVVQVSVDECYLDMSGTRLLYPDPIQTAHQIKDDIHKRLGFTVNIGISRNKLLAKMASDFDKPDKVHTLFPEEIPKKLWPLPIRDLFSVGQATAEKLERQGIKTIGTLAQLEEGLLKAMVGEKMGMQLHAYANGIDDSPVSVASEQAKGYSNSVTLSEDVHTLEQAHRVLLSLADSVAFRMRAGGVKALCVGVTIRTNEFKTTSHQRKLNDPTNITDEILTVSESLLRELWDRRTPLRLMGISLTMLTQENSEQVSLFPDEKRERGKRIDFAVDALRSQFGKGIICRAAQLSDEDCGSEEDN